jgi:hypothetical protein
MLRLRHVPPKGDRGAAPKTAPSSCKQQGAKVAPSYPATGRSARARMAFVHHFLGYTLNRACLSRGSPAAVAEGLAAPANGRSADEGP